MPFAASHGVDAGIAIETGMAEKAEEFRRTREIYVANDLRVGLFASTEGF